MSEQAKVVSGFVVGIVLACAGVVALSALRTSFVDAAVEAATAASAPAPVAMGAAPPPQAVRVVRTAASAPAVAPAIVVAPAAPAPPAAHRSWPKTAIVIGGSTAAGAGVGAIVGGKKGALIGAAIGGGASTIYETTRH